jgi:hypothetical protein
LLKKFSITFLILASSLAAAPYQKKVEGEKLKIYSHLEKRRGNTVYFYSRNKKNQDVILTYGDTKIRANEATLQETQNKIMVKGGFYSDYLNNQIVGQTLVYNPLNNLFEAKNVTVSSKHVVSTAESFSFYGEKITLKKASFGIDQLKLDLEFEKVDLYPGWVVADQVYIKLFSMPLIYTPTLVMDKRRNSYKLPDPLPEVGKTSFRGDYWRFNTHYYVNEFLYGNLQFGRAKEKGAGYGGQFIFRLSDYDQFNYINENWQYDRTEEVFSFEHSFIEVPRLKKKMTFNELLRYNEELSELEANSLRINKTRFEEINEEIINREMEMIYEGNFALPWYQLHLQTVNSGAQIEELSTARESKKYETKSELERPSEIQYLGPFTPGIGYDSIIYSVDPYSWHRIYDYIYASRKFWIFETEARITDYLDERGGSPFNFDRKFELSDNVRTSMYLNIWNTKIGQTTKYSTIDGTIFDILYHLRFKTTSWGVKVDYSLRKDYWTFGIDINVL